MYVLVEIHNGLSTRASMSITTIGMSSRASMSITTISIVQELGMMHLVLALKLT